MNHLMLAMILSWRSSQEYIELGLSIEYHAKALPLATMAKDFAIIDSFPPVKATAAS